MSFEEETALLDKFKIKAEKRQIVETSEIKAAYEKDIGPTYDTLKDLLGGTIQEMLGSQMDEHLGYHEYECSDNPDYRNGKKTKKIRGNFGETAIEVPQDRDGTFEPKVLRKFCPYILVKMRVASTGAAC